MNITPYIGITDFMDFKQVTKMLHVFNARKQPASKRQLHVGVTMSYKTLNDIPTKWQRAFPPKERIADIFSSEETLNCLHYADFDDRSDLTDNLVKAIGFGGIGIHALQLDMVWPDPGSIAQAVHASRKNLQVILQVGKNAMAEVNDDPDELVERLEDYRTVIHRVLLDKSMGNGIGMDAEELLPFASAVRENFPDLGLCAAGGLGPDTMHLVEPLLEEFPDISIDAQGRLRPSGNALDPIDWALAEKYIVRALQLVD